MNRCQCFRVRGLSVAVHASCTVMATYSAGGCVIDLKTTLHVEYITYTVIVAATIAAIVASCDIARDSCTNYNYSYRTLTGLCIIACSQA